MRTRLLSSALLLCAAFSASAYAADPPSEKHVIDRGRYLSQIGGCHDCHTPNYPESAGNVPREQWLTGSSVGFQGPWGTSYPVNLRLYVREMSEAQWLKRVREPMRPPMPWFNLRDMADRDLVALYRFLYALGPAGEPAPAPAAPGVAVNTPYFEFVPKNLPRHASR